jgi:hypothetical protein
LDEQMFSRCVSRVDLRSGYHVDRFGVRVARLFS